MAFLSQIEIKKMGFKSVGFNALISDKASFYNCNNIVIGDHVRIDDFCVLSAGEGGITLGRYIHIAVYTSLIGGGAIKISDYSNISSKVAIYSSNDDYSGEFMTNPTLPKEYTNVSFGDVDIGKHVIIGSGSVVLPNILINDGVAVGALSLVNDSCKAFTVYAGTPAKEIKERKKELLNLESKFINIVS